jgi:type VI secretion system protein ImpL
MTGAETHARIYTREVFQTEVTPAALGLRGLLDRMTDSPALRDQLAQQLGQALEAYATGYEQELARVIASFHVELSTEVAAQRILRVLAGAGSPMRALIAVVAHDADLGLAADNASVFDAMVAIQEHYGALAQLLVAGKAGDPFAAYQDVLRALAGRLAAVPADKPGAAAAPSPSAAIAARLSPAGALAFGAAQGAPDAPAAALDAWLADKPLTDELADVFRGPVRAVYALGARNVEAALAAWDRDIDAAAEAEVFSRFPFDRSSGDDLDPETLTAWLGPKRGRFAAELLPAVAGFVVQTRGWDGRAHHGAAHPCSDELCVHVPSALLARFDRLAAAADALWDDAGKPRALELSVTPRPFTLTGGGPVPELVRLTVGDQTAFYFNQRPKRTQLALDWTHDQTASLSVQLKQDGSVLLTPPAVVSSGTPWSLFHLLQQAERRGQTYTWQIKLSTSQVLTVGYDVVDPTEQVIGGRPRTVAIRRRR